MNLRRRARAAGIAIALVLVTPAGTVLAAPPSNDDIGSPFVAPGVPYTNSQSTVEATTGATDFDCVGDVNTVWYELTASASGRLEANTFGSNFDTTLTVGTPDGAGGIAVIACNDDTLDLQSRVRWDAVAGTTYLFQVGSCGGGSGGDLVFNIDVAPPFVPTVISMTLNNTGRVDRNGVATISGTYTCEGADEINLEVALRQRVGRFFVNGGTGASLACVASASWELQIESNGGTFGGGKVQVSLFAFACGEECDTVEIQRTISLRR